MVDKEVLPANNYTDAVENLRCQYSAQLDPMLDSTSGYNLLKRAEERYGSVLPDVFDIVKNQRSRLNSIISHIEAAVKEYKYDVFISCKSEDYSKARELQDFLKPNGHNPFLAETSLREIGIDKYTLVIGQVLDSCDSFILFSSKPEYVVSSYVTAEWSFFINEVNSGRKARGKIVNVLTSDFDIRLLSPWLRDKQCFTTDNYELLGDLCVARCNLYILNIQQLRQLVRYTLRLYGWKTRLPDRHVAYPAELGLPKLHMLDTERL